MHRKRTMCASCDFQTWGTMTDDFDLPICHWCADLAASRPESFPTILDQRAFVRPLRVTITKTNPAPPPTRRKKTKWTPELRTHLTR